MYADACFGPKSEPTPSWTAFDPLKDLTPPPSWTAFSALLDRIWEG
jgi:hypothetical protein